MRDDHVFSGIHEEWGENMDEILQELLKGTFALTTMFVSNGCIAWRSGLNITYTPGTCFKEKKLIRTRAPQ